MSHRLMQWCETLFPICRSLTGEGVRQTLAFIQQQLPELIIHNVPSGTQAFDWTVPNEWHISEAYIEDMTGNRIIDFKNSNLHVVGYSTPINTTLTFTELNKHLHSLPNQPEAIPYITSYYQPRWGFCLKDTQRQEMAKYPNQKYKVVINALLEPGVLNYGELIIPGQTKDEILLSTYVCHPSMANNELSGPVVCTALAQWLQNTVPQRRYTYRILFLVETIGSIVYLSQHLKYLKEHVKAGFVLTCVGDDRTYSYVESRYANTLADKVARHTLSFDTMDFQTYTFLDRGSDERQYCAPGIELPVCSICRSKYNEYPEYHTSLDDLSMISEAGLQGALNVYKNCIQVLEGNHTYLNTALCEPQLGKRGLYPTLSTIESAQQTRNMMNVLAYADGKNDLIDIANKLNVYAKDLIPLCEKLHNKGLLKIQS